MATGFLHILLDESLSFFVWLIEVEQRGLFSDNGLRDNIWSIFSFVQ